MFNTQGIKRKVEWEIPEAKFQKLEEDELMVKNHVYTLALKIVNCTDHTEKLTRLQDLTDLETEIAKKYSRDKTKEIFDPLIELFKTTILF